MKLFDFLKSADTHKWDDCPEFMQDYTSANYRLKSTQEWIEAFEKGCYPKVAIPTSKDYITIYRGITIPDEIDDVEDYVITDGVDVGISWTLCPEVASRFDEGCLLTATLKVGDEYTYLNNKNGEKEVIVNPTKLSNIKADVWVAA